jgi:hypothetical protein
MLSLVGEKAMSAVSKDRGPRQLKKSLKNDLVPISDVFLPACDAYIERNGRKKDFQFVVIFSQVF